jgi:hypothetical protein
LYSFTHLQELDAQPIPTAPLLRSSALPYQRSAPTSYSWRAYRSLVTIAISFNKVQLPCFFFLLLSISLLPPIELCILTTLELSCHNSNATFGKFHIPIYSLDVSQVSFLYVKAVVFFPYNFFFGRLRPYLFLVSA